jgi:hypothetical protein
MKIDKVVCLKILLAVKIILSIVEINKISKIQENKKKIMII